MHFRSHGLEGDGYAVSAPAGCAHEAYLACLERLEVLIVGCVVCAYVWVLLIVLDGHGPILTWC